MIMKRLILCAVLFLILLPNLSYASRISSHTISIDLDAVEQAHMVVTLDYKEITTEKLSYLVFGRVSNVKAEDFVGTLECELEHKTYGAQVSCRPNVDATTNYTVTLHFDVEDLVSKSVDAYLFRYDYGVKDPTDNIKLEVTLPEGTGLVETTDKFKPYFPEDASVGSKFGRRVVLTWENLNPELGKTYTFTVTFEALMGFNYNYLYILIAVVIGLIIYFWWSRRTTKIETILSVLKEDEKKVLEIILEKGEECKQRDIVRGTTFSKAKVSRIIADLEDRRLIRKKPVGRVNKIVLVDRGLKKMKK